MSEDIPKGFYVSRRTADGWLFSVAGDSWADVKTDLEDIFGEGHIDDVLEQIVGGGTPGDEPLPSSGVSAPPPTPSSTQDQGRLEETLKAAAQSEFKPCSKCGTIKDKWVPPGLSKTKKGPDGGPKPYPGFWACPNPSCR